MPVSFYLIALEQLTALEHVRHAGHLYLQRHCDDPKTCQRPAVEDGGEAVLSDTQMLG